VYVFSAVVLISSSLVSSPHQRTEDDDDHEDEWNRTLNHLLLCRGFLTARREMPWPDLCLQGLTWVNSPIAKSLKGRLVGREWAPNQTACEFDFSGSFSSGLKRFLLANPG
jgi:hypothetical protein